MSVLSLGLVLVAILAAVVLLFPVVFRADFRLTESGFEANLFVFKKKLWNCTKVWKEESEPEEIAESVKAESPVANAPASKVENAPIQNVELSVAKAEPETVPEKPAPEPKPAEEQPAKTTKPSPAQEPKPQTSSPELETPAESEESEKESLTEREFWTLVLTPDIDERGYRYSKKILNSFVKLFQVRFRDCYVEGIRMGYESMGYGAAVNAMMKGYPFLEDWDLRMDWTRDHDLQSAGHIEAKVNLCRTIGFLTVSSVYGGIFAFVFWRRRAHVLKTGELPELDYVRNKILNWIVEE